MRVCVTGAAGFIGSHLCERLVDDGHDVTGISRSWTDNLASLTGNQRFQHYELDLLDCLPPFNYGEFAEVDVIVHAAALAGTGPSWGRFADYLWNNDLLTQRILEVIRFHHPRLVYISSSSVYGSEAVGGEDSPLRPCNPYGVSKLAAEALVHAYEDVYGLKATIIRPFSIYGPRQRPDMFHHIAIKALLTGTPLTVDGDGSQRRANTYVADLVDGICRAIYRPARSIGQTFNLGGGECVSILDTIRILEHITGCQAQLEFGPKRIGDQRITAADCTRARNRLGWEPTTSLREGLTRQVNWQRNLAEVPA